MLRCNTYKITAQSRPVAFILTSLCLFRSARQGNGRQSKAKTNAPELFPQSVTDSGLSLLPIEPAHLAVVSRLPLHHRDPFDRLLIAQARVEGLTIVTCDPHFQAYGTPILW